MYTLILVLLALGITLSHAMIPEEMTVLENKHVKPCDDFYEYACGKWIHQNHLHDSDVHSFQVMDDKNKVLFKQIINKKHALIDELWESCLSERHTNDFPFRREIAGIFNLTSREKIMEMAGQFFRTGAQAFTTLTIEPDSSDAKTNTIYVSPASLPGMDYFYDRFDQMAEKYRHYINELFKLTKVNTPKITKWAAQEAGRFVVDFEVDLAMMKKRHHGPTRRMTITDAMEKWPLMIGEFFKGVGILEKTNVNKEFKIFIEKSDYFDAMENFIKSSYVKDLKMFLIFNVIHSRVHWMGENYYKIWFKLYHKVTGESAPQNRESFCVSRLIQYMPDLFGKYYTEEAFDKKREHYAFEMTKYMTQVMGEHIENAKWLQEKDKTEAKAKLDNMLLLIGQSSVSQLYPSHISRYEYSSNVRSIVTHSFDERMKKVGQPVNRKEWIESPATANAFYSLRENRLVLPTAILQPPLFHGEKVHPARNFGAIGTIIGHEMTHAFDTMGNMFDRQGNVREWWSEATAKDFKIRADRMKLQYSTYNVRGHYGVIGTVDGELTLVENIADNGGLALAWDAYRKFITKLNPQDPQAMGVSRKQGDRMFFLAFAQTWCTNTREDTMRKLLHTDDRTPAKWRVNGAVMNNDDFAKTFECKSGDAMNPSTKLKIW